MRRRSPREMSNVLLLVCLSGIFLVHPHTTCFAWSRTLLHALFTGPIALAIVAQSTLPRATRAAFITLGGVATLLTWAPVTLAGPLWLLPTTYTVFFGLCTAIYGWEVFRDSEVDTHTLVSAAITYVFLGLAFASAFALLMALDPDAVLLPSESTEPLADLTYFSFVTLTTLGYGDVLPQSEPARMLAVYEAIVGQLFVAVAVAVLVGLHVSNAQGPRPSE